MYIDVGADARSAVRRRAGAPVVKQVVAEPTVPPLDDLRRGSRATVDSHMPEI